jgi:hypothetical protein
VTQEIDVAAPPVPAAMRDPRRIRCLLGWAATGGTAAGAFGLYGGLRGMSETFGFDARTSGGALLVECDLGAPLVLAALLLVRFVLRERMSGELQTVLVIGCCAGALVGTFASEALFLWDESQFLDEVTAHPGANHSRSRMFPHTDCSLVYIPGRGIHATD